MFDLAKELLEIECPQCSYVFDIQYLDVSCQVRRECPCCRIRIHFIEPDGSVSGSIQDVGSAFREFDKTLRSRSK